MQALSARSTPAPIEGIDVSEYQGQVNWAAVAQFGIHFAAIKATEGLGYQDPMFAQNWQRARRRGLIRIAYHYLLPSLDGAEQADYLHEYVRMSGRFGYGDGVMLDVEALDNQDPQAIVSCAEAFVAEIIHTTIAGVFVYCSPNFWVGYLGDPISPILGRCPLWLADYGPYVPPLKNWPTGLSIWQYSDSGSVSGITGAVDLDRFYGTIQQLQLLCREGGR